MTSFGNPVQGPRIVPYLNVRLPSDKLPNGHPGFRVTQRFGDRDIFFGDGRIHGAMDLGNYYCGDKVLGMRYGRAKYLVDTSGALGIEVRHMTNGQYTGWISQIWHVSRFRVGNGGIVRKGQWIADVGSTGLDIGGCHAHVVLINPQGKAVDPWPYLAQNQ